MVGSKTRAQQKRIINREEKTSGGDVPVKEDLAAGEGLKKARREGENLTAPQKDLVDPDDRNILRGRGQESRKTTPE